jgi:undecaprenyl-phosphate 4-deoxy-4-formamido-L-arabinose transferase
VVSVASVIIYLAIIAKRVLGGEMGGGAWALWDRDILEFLLIGLMLFGLGLVGEYVGRIYEQVRGRPRYIVGAVLEKRD